MVVYKNTQECLLLLLLLLLLLFIFKLAVVDMQHFPINTNSYY